MSATDTDNVEVAEPTELDRFMDRWNKRLQRDNVIMNWHIELHQATGVELPWSASDQYVTCNQGDYVDNNYVIDEDATVKIIAKVIQFAVKKGYKVEKSFNDDRFRATIAISDDPYVRMQYSADRKVVCTPKVVGQEFVPAQIIEAKTVDVVEWECTKLSFLGIDTDDNS